jgi:1-acyl-sn-glycerol-3-phosphate acyltransferase
MTTTDKILEPGIYRYHNYIRFAGILYRGLGIPAAVIFGRTVSTVLTPSDIDKAKSYLVVSNHQTWLDPSVITANIPLTLWSVVGWPRAFANNRFFSVPLFGIFLRSIGAFPAREHPRDPYGLAYAEHLLSIHQSIIIFPEGRITLSRENPARRGVEVLAHLANVEVIPVHLGWRRAGILSSYRIAIGKPFDAHDMTAQEILDHVYSLPF